jgi:hypothetical protein
MKVPNTIEEKDGRSDIGADILANINDPKNLERLYRKNELRFQRGFNDLYPAIKDHAVAGFWHERLHFKQDSTFRGSRNDVIFILLASLITGLLAKIPLFTGIEEDLFFSRNIGLLAFPMLMVYFLWKQQTGYQQWILPFLSVVASACYINLLPYDNSSDSIMLASMHLPIFLWVILGYAFIGGDLNDGRKKIDYLRYNGDLVVMTSIIVLSGILFTAITIGLFDLIGLNIGEFYFQHVAIWGIGAIPVLATHLVRNNPQMVNKMSPLIARIFTPLVFATLLVFLSALIYTGKNLYDDRNILLLFNVVLIGVMALILFSVTEATKQDRGRLNLMFLVGLSVLSIIINGIALSAIVFRLSAYGMTPNRIAVLGGNILIFIHLIFVAHRLIRALREKETMEKVESVITLLLPAYGIWTAFVIFILPLLFHFK